MFDLLLITKAIYVLKNWDDDEEKKKSRNHLFACQLKMCHIIAYTQYNFFSLMCFPCSLTHLLAHLDFIYIRSRGDRVLKLSFFTMTIPSYTRVQSKYTWNTKNTYTRMLKPLELNSMLQQLYEKHSYYENTGEYIKT